MPKSVGYDIRGPILRSPSTAVVRGDIRQAYPRHNPFLTLEDGDGNRRLAIMARFLHRRIVEQRWIEQVQQTSSSHYTYGLALREDGNDSCILEPPNAFPELSVICSKLNISAAFTMNSQVSDHIISKIPEGQTEVTLQPNHITVPIVQSLHELATSDTSVRRRDYLCFVRQEGLVLVWSISTDELLTHAADVEDKLVASVWGSVVPPGTATSSRQQPIWQVPTYALNSPTRLSLSAPSVPDLTHYRSFNDSASVLAPKGQGDFDSSADFSFDAEDAEALRPVHRPFVLTHSAIVSIAFLLIIVAQSSSVSEVIVEVRALGKAGLIRLAMLATVPFYMAFGLFFFTILVVCVFQALGPIQDVKCGNSKFYSSVKPERRKHLNMQWPHITIQMPVHKEGLKGVIQPTINSLLPAILHYERLGGTASIFVCEDGMQVVSPEIAEMRKKFYRAHGIGWVARPPHGKDGFIRGGRFKKASNMNFGLEFTLRVEDELLRLLQARAEETECREDEIDVEEENSLYNLALETILKRDEGRAWAEGNIRMGEIILLIDCDTRVPVDCLSLAAMEMEESPEVAIIQHASGVMQVTYSMFENVITYFTNLVYLSIKFAVGNGDMSPFVGHNAFMRWKALQSVCFKDSDGKVLFWSESHVSEDFDMALRLQTAGFVVRLATYDEGEFKEGVSLTIFDELLRWEKYAYGCSELLFNLVYKWLFKGLFTLMLGRILTSNMKVTSKFTIFGYIGTYYAIASALPLSIINYFLVGWMAEELDALYHDSFKIFVGLIAVFQIISPLAFALYRHRLGNKVFWRAYFEGMKWSFFFVIFFGGISWHLSYALIAHLFSLPIEWTSTAKELEATGFFISLERVLKMYRWVLLFTVPMMGAMIYLGEFAPPGWTINTFVSIIPLATQIGGHIGLPLLSILL